MILSEERDLRQENLGDDDNDHIIHEVLNPVVSELAKHTTLPHDEDPIIGMAFTKSQWHRIALALNDQIADMQDSEAVVKKVAPDEASEDQKDIEELDTLCKAIEVGIKATDAKAGE